MPVCPAFVNSYFYKGGFNSLKFTPAVRYRYFP